MRAKRTMTSPTLGRLVGAALPLMLGAACVDGGGLPIGSSLAPSQPAYTLTGVVTEITRHGRTAVGDTAVVIRDRDVPRGSRFQREVWTDAQGRYVATGIAPCASLVVVADKFDCVQPAAVIIVVDRDTAADVEVVCGPVEVPHRAPALFGFLLDSRQRSPSSRWVYFDAACDSLFEAGAITDLDGSYQLSRLPLGPACLHSHGKIVEVNVSGDTRFDVDMGALP